MEKHGTLNGGCLLFIWRGGRGGVNGTILQCRALVNYQCHSEAYIRYLETTFFSNDYRTVLFVAI